MHEDTKKFNEEKKIPEKEIIADIHLVNKISCDILSAGFPCQDVATLGPGSGISGQRSSVIYEIFKIVKANNIKCVFLENSPLIVSRGMDEILKNFKIMKMNYVWGIFYARDSGSIHLRKRWYCLAFKSKSILPNVARYNSPKNVWPLPPLNLRLTQKQPKNLARLAALGNSVVPQCVTLAFETLVSHALAGVLNQIIPERSLSLLEIKSIRILDEPARSIGTPTKSHWGQHSKLQWRIQKSTLSNQLFWDNATWKNFKKSNLQREHLHKYYDINPTWIEKYMGYPRGWTDF